MARTKQSPLAEPTLLLKHHSGSLPPNPSSSSSSTKYRFVCYIRGCGRTFSTKEDHSRQFKAGKEHAGLVYNSKKVFKIASADVPKADDTAIKSATNPQEWLRARYPNWSTAMIDQYITKHDCYKGTGRKDRK